MKLNKISFQLIAKERLKIFEYFLALTIKNFLPVIYWKDTFLPEKRFEISIKGSAQKVKS